jgi:zinc and cadmium transporter
MTLLLLLLGCAAVMLASLSGKLVTVRYLGPIIERNLSFLVSLAAGVLLVIVYGLIQETIEHTGSLGGGFPWIVAGALFVLVAFRYIPGFHHHHDEHAGGHTHDRIDANRVLASDAIHNTTDGILLAAAFSASPIFGILTTVSVFFHELLQEVSEFFVLRQAGLSTARALLYNFLASSTILIGALGGYFLIEQFEALELPMLGLAAGSYLIVVFHDLIPHSHGRAYDVFWTRSRRGVWTRGGSGRGTEPLTQSILLYCAR